MTSNKRPRWKEIFGSGPGHACTSFVMLAGILSILFATSRLKTPVMVMDQPWAPHTTADQRPTPPLNDAVFVIKSNWTAIPNPCTSVSYDRADIVNWLKRRYWCHRQRYFAR